MEILLTIGIPYYETYSLTMQLLKELSIQKNNKVEVLLIDDYCKKEFQSIKDELALNNIKLIEHINNMGVAKSRNEIIDKSRGKYIAFCDGDDQITMDYIETLLNAIDTYDTDVINFNWYDMTEHIEYRKPHNPAPWKQIYKKETMPRFSEEYEYGHEDVPFQAEIDSGKYTITYLDKMIYLYNSNREGSLYWKKTHKGGE